MESLNNEDLVALMLDAHRTVLMGKSVQKDEALQSFQLLRATVLIRMNRKVEVKQQPPEQSRVQEELDGVAKENNNEG